MKSGPSSEQVIVIRGDLTFVASSFTQPRRVVRLASTLTLAAELSLDSPDLGVLAAGSAIG